MADINQEFNHAPNDSPRSGCSKQVSPLIWCIIVVVMVAAGTWLAMTA
jgi:hypothetical protein